jgi:hypothetical protein
VPTPSTRTPLRVVGFELWTWIALPAVFCALGLPQLVRNGFGLALGTAFAVVAAIAVWPRLHASTFRPSRSLFYGGLLFVGAPTMRPLVGTTTADWIFALSFLALVAEVFTNRAPTPRVPPRLLMAGVGIFLFASAISAAVSSTPASALAAGVKFAVVTGAWIWLGILVLESVNEVCVGLLAWSMSAAAASVAGFVQLVFGDVIPGTTPAWHRMTGLDPQVNEFGVVTATGLLAVVGLFMLTRGRDRRLLGAMGFLLIGGLLLSGSLSAMAGLLIGIVVGIALSGRRLLRVIGQRRILIGAGAAFAVVLGALAFGVATGRITAPWSRLSQTTSTAGGTGLAHQQATLWTRIRTLETGWETIKAHPLFGAGQNPDGVGLAHGTYVHDTPLGAWAGLGFLAMIGVILCLAAPFVSAKGLLRARPDIKPLVIALTGAAATFTGYALANPALYRRYGWVSALFLFALAQPALAWRRAAAGRVPADAPPAVGVRFEQSGSGAFSRAMPRTGLVLAAVAVVLALVVGAAYALGKRSSGSSSAVTVTAPAAKRPPPKPPLLMPRDLARYPVASPQYSLLAWWRAAQFGDYSTYLSGFTSQVQHRLAADPKTKRAFVAFTGFADYAAVKFAAVKILSVRGKSPGAKLYVVATYRAGGPNGTVLGTYPHMFTLVRQGGVWRQANDDFVQEIVPPSLRSR